MARLREGVTLFFIRHGQTEWNKLGRLQGQMDIPLNDTGRQQAARNGRALRAHLNDRLDAANAPPFIASPLIRTCETMEIVREAAGLPRDGYQTDNRLREVHYGHWEGAYLSEVAETDPDGYAMRQTDKFNWQPHGGESYAMLTARVDTWLAEVDRDTVVVSHGGVSRVIRGRLLGLDWKEVPVLTVPQDQIMMIRQGEVDWL